MNSNLQQAVSEVPDVFERLAIQVKQYGVNASTNLQESFSRMTIQSYIRLVMVVGGYMLLRHQAMKFMAKGAVDRMEKEDAKEKAQLSANDLRGEKSPQKDEDEGGDATGADWGAKARIRQREMLKQMLEADERRRQEEEEDKDIQEFLED